MAETASFTKILRIREKEKNDAQKAYYQSLEFFEEMATKLYHLLRKKEVAEKSYEEYLEGITSIDVIKEQSAYIEILNNQIMSLQLEVQKARTDMDSKQIKLSAAHTEVKKFEKIIEFRKRSQMEKEQKLDMQFMDEIAVQQFITRKKTGETDGEFN